MEVTDKISLPGTMSSSTPHNHYTRLVLDGSGQNVYGISDEDKSIRGYVLYGRATHWSGDNYQNKKDLGSLKEDNSGSSQITSIAQDGKILGGFGHTTTNINDRVHAGIWSDIGFSKKTLISTDDPARSTSYIYALSGDGKVIAGSRNGWSNLAILKNDGSDWTKAIELPKLPHQTNHWFSVDNSQVLALNHDGSIAVGSSISNFSDDTNSDNIRPVVWTGNNWQTITDLGTLKADNTGIGQANAISADGKVIGGYSNVDDRANIAATIWTGDNWQTKIRLNGLTNYGNDPHYQSTKIYTLTKDGKIAGGTSTDYRKNGNNRPVIWSGENYEVITDLGTLDKGFAGILAGNTMEGVVTSFNDDGTIIAGFSEDDNNDRGSWKPVVWKVKYTDTTTTPPPTTTPTPPVVTPPTPTPPPVVAPPTPTTPPAIPTPTPIVVGRIDVENTAKTIAQLGEDSFALMSMQSHALDRLQYACNMRDGRLNGFCFGLQEDISISKAHDDRRLSDIGLGVNVGYGFGNGLSVGLSLDHSAHRKLPSSFKHDGDDVGVGAVVRYQSPNGYFGEISGAYDDYRATITRPTLANTELGVNETTIKGKSYGAKVGKVFGTDDKHLKAYVGLKHTDISRDAYRENEQSAFPISYGQMQYKQTAVTAGVKTRIAMTDKLSWVSDVGVSQKISGDDPTYTASLTGVEQHNFSHTANPAKTQGHIATGVSYQVAPQTHIDVLPYVNKNANGENGGGALLRIESTF